MSSTSPSPVPAAGQIAPALDDIDQAILRELTRDGRLAIRLLAERLNISRASAYARLERLKERGVLTGFTAVVDPARAGLSTSAYITLTVRQSSWRDLAGHLRRIPEVKHMALVGGEFDVMLLVRAVDNEHLRRVVLDVLPGIPGVLGTRTFLIFDDLVNP
ncbi:Lrp/AsnC family transcriptional regulator [Prauserella muralis]|uniref:Transcriptional regulator n=1 Tax=Prauserella muralis TaxID=588067 RepID=A0A2V4APX0_9PSEU|nr:Lrp/AsnC family transcriptional regulator [Prauserella muralis]PXY22753.1 transcriptional regulator [Prauserella muralis]TWE28482.1 AsnC family transcriptional regulator [Prauserella muralis]